MNSPPYTTYPSGVHMATPTLPGIECVSGKNSTGIPAILIDSSRFTRMSSI